MLDYRQYGAWYLHPRKWENRFQSLSDPKSIEIVKSRRIPRGDKPASKQDVATKKVICFIVSFSVSKKPIFIFPI